MKLATTIEPRDVRVLRKFYAEVGKLLASLPADVGTGRRSAKQPPGYGQPRPKPHEAHRYMKLRQADSHTESTE